MKVVNNPINLLKFIKPARPKMEWNIIFNSAIKSKYLYHIYMHLNPFPKKVTIDVSYCMSAKNNK